MNMTRWAMAGLLVLAWVGAVIGQSGMEKKVADWERIPLIDYTYWCVPTSQAMILAFYDSHVPGTGLVTGYGRLVEYWMDHSQGSNAPSLIDILIDPATKTWRRRPDGSSWPNAETWTKENFGYDFSFPSTQCSAANDYCWQELKSEIDSGRPLMWSPAGHCVVAFGYGVRANGERYVITYDPPNHSVPTSRVDYDYTRCESIRKVIPGSQGRQPGHDLAILAPDGGEVLPQHIPCQITWSVWGDQIRTADLDYSVDGGTTWIPIAKGIGVTSGTNTRVWAPPVATTSGRIRIRGYSGNGVTLVAADGSQKDFVVSPASGQAPSWCACAWHDVGALKSHQDLGAWCPPGSFITQLDLDAAGGASPADSPVVRSARCCHLCGWETTSWGACAWHEIGYDKTHFQVGEWCPPGTYLTQLDLDRDTLHGERNSPIVGRAKCCGLSGLLLAPWAAVYWQEVGPAMSHQRIADWCPPGTFLTQLDWDGVAGTSVHDTPVVGRCACSQPAMTAQMTVVEAPQHSQPSMPDLTPRTEDFEDGRAQDWVLSGAWTIERDPGGNHLLRGEGHHFAQHVVEEWGDFSLRLRVHPVEGGLHICFRASDCRRYFVSFQEYAIVLSKTDPCGVHTELQRAARRHLPSRWYGVEIVARGGTIEVLVDGSLVVSYRDPYPLAGGSLALETLEGSLFYVDDIVISPLDR